MNERWRAIDRWCTKRGINQVYSFFAGCDTELSQHETRVRYFMRRQGLERLTDTDEAWIASMERTVETLNQMNS